jgi:hypothetical protein
MKIENATLKESMECMDHLISSIHRLHLALLKVNVSSSHVQHGDVLLFWLRNGSAL